MKKLVDLLPCNYDVDILGIAEDSRMVKPGYLFVATKGYFTDHFDFISDAIAQGAVAVICDREIEVDVPVVYVSDVNSCYPILCQRFYDVVPDDFHFLGITGTDGKTTTAILLHYLLSFDTTSAYIGTNGVSISEKNWETNNTTPCLTELYDTFSKLKNNNCQTICMEVSSEALLHHRVDSLLFDIVAFTNITEDHLNVHKTVENYRNCKFRLLSLLKPGGIVLANGDDVNCNLIEHDNLFRYGFSSENDYVIFDVNKMSNFVNFKIKCKDTVFCIESPLLGIYNVYNVTLAFLIAWKYGLSPDVLVDRIRNFPGVLGRREKLNFGQKFDIILDYAHTFNGVSCLLDSVSDYSRIITVTGAAGGREVEKRKKIGSLVMRKSDYVIFTMDDPREEDVNDIIDQMLLEVSSSHYERIVDRKLAIYKALDMALEGDVVLILGKGRDSYMAIGNRRVPYCDYDVISSYFEKKG